MVFFQTLILGIVQGITEFLPISSSGHLNILQHFFGSKPSLSLDIFLNTATFCSVLFYFCHQIKFFFGHLPHIILASVPAAIVGFSCRHQLELIFGDFDLLPWFYFLTTALLFCTRFFKSTDRPITYLDAFIIGLFQVIAILPGVSRAGATIFAALLLGLPPITAFNFSFSLFIPASIGAIVLDFNPTIWQIFSTPGYFVTFIVTLLVGLLSLSLLRQTLASSRLWLFAFYTFSLGLFLMLL